MGLGRFRASWLQGYPKKSGSLGSSRPMVLACGISGLRNLVNSIENPTKDYDIYKGTLV